MQSIRTRIDMELEKVKDLETFLEYVKEAYDHDFRQIDPLGTPPDDVKAAVASMLVVSDIISDIEMVLNRGGEITAEDIAEEFEDGK
jgi:hypothetical protein